DGRGFRCVSHDRARARVGRPPAGSMVAAGEKSRGRGNHEPCAHPRTPKTVVLQRWGSPPSTPAPVECPMPSYSLSHVPDHVLLRDLAAVVARDRAITADLLAHLGEVDARKLYPPAAYPSMFAYCVGELRLSEDAAAKRLRAARTARRCPGVLAALADGRLHLGAIVLLAPPLTPETEAELLAAATHKSKSEIELLLAERFPCLDVPATVDAIATRPSEPAPGPVNSWPVPQLDRGQPHPRVTPLSPQSF